MSLHNVIRVHEHCELLFINLEALFMFHEQCKKKKKTQMQLREMQIQTLIESVWDLFILL